MKLTAKNAKQFLLVTGLMIAGLLIVNSFGLNIAMAQGGGPINPDSDVPPIIRYLMGGNTGLKGIVVAIVNFFLGFLGLLAVVMVIYAGFLYVSSAGNEENVGKAKKILLYAVIGIILITVSFLLVQAILGSANSPSPT